MSLTYGFALQDTDNSADFSNAMQAVFGGGITLEGGQFAISANGFKMTLSSGYALAAGRWVKNDEPLTLNIGASGNNNDRTDAIAVRVDYEERKATVEVLVDVNPADMITGNGLLPMYLIRIRRGVTSLTPDDVTDVRGDRIIPLSAISEKVLYIYNFLLSGIDTEVARIVSLSNHIADKADTAIAELDEAIQKAGGTAEIGELLTSRKPPAPETEWLLCDGGSVPAEYPALSEMVDGTLPDIPGERYKTYIYGGTPFTENGEQQAGYTGA